MSSPLVSPSGHLLQTDLPLTPLVFEEVRAEPSFPSTNSSAHLKSEQGSERKGKQRQEAFHKSRFFCGKMIQQGSFTEPTLSDRKNEIATE